MSSTGGDSITTRCVLWVSENTWEPESPQNVLARTLVLSRILLTRIQVQVQALSRLCLNSLRSEVLQFGFT